MLEIFSTRETAIIIWSTIFIVVAIFLVKFKMTLNLLKIFFSYKIQIPLWLMFLYISGIIVCLSLINFWNIDLLKDTIIWSITSATVLFFKVNNAKDFEYFKPIFLANLKVIVVLEFITNFYTFSFLTEMVFIPTMTFIGVLQIAAEYSSEKNPEHSKVASCLKKVFSTIGIFIFLYVSYETYKHFNQLLTLQNMKSLLLPIILATLLIPYLYFLALYMNYEILFVRIPYLLKDEKKAKKLKKNILLLANVNLNKLIKINRNLNWSTLKENKIRKSLKKILYKTSL